MDDALRLTSKDIVSHNAVYEAMNERNHERQHKCSPCVEAHKICWLKSLKKIHLPDQAKQLAQAEIVKKSLSFDGAGYTASHPYNKYLTQLEENQGPCKRMMKSLESKLRKDNLVEPFNANVLDFMRRGVIQWINDLPKIESLQRSSDIHTKK